MKVCLLASGGLGLAILKELYGKHAITAVFTDKNSDGIIAICKDYGIKIFIGNPRNGKAADFIKDIECNVLLSVNYLFIVNDDLIKLPSGFAINIHGSLLPKYRGRTPHVWAIINGEKETGITAHLIKEGVDTGEIIAQVRIPINEGDTGATLLKKYNEIYPELINRVLEMVESGPLQLTPQNEAIATYFGKRTPEDGRICWDWSRERIRNWIRAQAAPYPGAFSYYEGNKFIVNYAGFDETGFQYNMANGLILKADEDHIIVKTHNGALYLGNIVKTTHFTFIEGTILE